MNEPQTYIERPDTKVRTVEAMFVTEENYQAVALWMGYNDIRQDKDGGWVLNNKSNTYHLEPNTFIVNKVQSMEPDSFRKKYKFWPKDML